MIPTLTLDLCFFEYSYHILSFMSASEICISFLISSVIVFVKYFLVSFVNLIPLLIRSFGIEFSPVHFRRKPT